MESTSQKNTVFKIQSKIIRGKRVRMEDDYGLGGKEIPVESLARGGRSREGNGGIRHWGAVELHGLRSPLMCTLLPREGDCPAWHLHLL